MMASDSPLRTHGKMAALAIGVLVVAFGSLAIGKLDPFSTSLDVLRNAFGSADAWSGTLKETAPLLGCGVAAYLALRAGLFNIGVEGQFMMGALLAAVVAVKAPPGLAIPLALLTGALCGALWAAPAGWIKAFRGGHEVITTIMLNQIAKQLSSALLSGPFKAPNQDATSTEAIPESAALPDLLTSPQIASSLLITLLLLIAFGFWLKRTVKGYELRVVGANPVAATTAGIRTPAVVSKAMASSGAIAGLAGALHVLSYERRVYEDFSSGYGFDALGVALLASSHPLAMIPSALFFGGLKQGFSVVGALNGVPRSISTFLLGLAIVLFAAYQYRRSARSGD